MHHDFADPGEDPAQPDDLDRVGVLPGRPRHQRRQLRGPSRSGPYRQNEGRNWCVNDERRCPKCGTVYADRPGFAPRR